MDICIWPDGTWCHREDIEEYSWMSDDFRIVSVPDNMEPEQIEELVLALQ